MAGNPLGDGPRLEALIQLGSFQRKYHTTSFILDTAKISFTIHRSYTTFRNMSGVNVL